MPIIPQSSGPSVSPSETPRVQPSLEDVGGGAAARPIDTSGLAQHVTEIYHKQVSDANQVAVSDADAQAVRAKTYRMWDPQVGAMNARGKDAIAAQDQAQSAFQQDMAKIEDGLTNNDQKVAFRNRVGLHFADLGNQLGQHVAGQIKQYDLDTTQGHLDALHDGAVASYADPHAVQQSVDDTKALLTDYWHRNGHSDGKGGLDDYAVGHIADRVSAIRAGVLQQIVESGSPQAADQAHQYLTAHLDEFKGKDRIAAEKMVKASADDTSAQRTADQIIGINQPTTQPPKPYADAVKEAEALTDPGMRKEVLNQIDAHYTRIERAERREREDALERLSKTLEDTGGQVNTASADYQKLLGHPEQTHLDLARERIIHPPKDPGDQDLFLQQLNMAGISPKTRADFLAQDVLKLPGLNTSQRTQLLTLQRQLSMGEERHDDADLKHYQAEVEKAQKSGDTDAEAEATRQVNRLQHEARAREADLARAHHQPIPAAPVAADSGATVLGATPGFKADPLAGVHLTPLTPVPLEWRERVSRDPKYAAYLKLHGYNIGEKVK